MMDNYKEQIAAYFASKLKKEGRKVTSEEDILLSLWGEAGVPLKVIIEGLDATFREGRERIFSLCNCQNAVLELWLDYKQSTQAGVVAGAKKEKLREDELEELFSRVASSFNAARFAAEKERNLKLIDVLDEFFKRLFRIKCLFERGNFTVEDLRLELFALDWELSNALPRTLTEKEFSLIKKEAEEKGISPADEVSFLRYLAEVVRRRFSLPPLLEFLPR
jgi:hypothetical protein